MATLATNSYASHVIERLLLSSVAVLAAATDGAALALAEHVAAATESVAGDGAKLAELASHACASHTLRALIATSAGLASGGKGTGSKRKGAGDGGEGADGAKASAPGALTLRVLNPKP